MSVPNEGFPPAVPPRRRSLLYVPASSGRMVRKAAGRGADLLVLDLEDGVHPAHKEEARRRLRESGARLAAGGGAPAAVRVNSPESAAGCADLETAAAAGFAAVLLPKTETRESVRAARRILGRDTPVWLMIETARGAAEAFTLAEEPGVEGLVFGAADYRLSVGCRGSAGEAELEYPRQRILLAARAAGIHCWDSPWFAFRDLHGLRGSARRAFELGFDGKSAVHPDQLPVIHAAFTPSPHERLRAERVVAAMESARVEGRAVAELDGELLEELHLRQAKRLLEM